MRIHQNEVTAKPSKSNEILSRALANEHKPIEIQSDPKGQPLQNACKSIEVQWNPKGYPLQNQVNRLKFNGIAKWAYINGKYT